MTPEEIASAYEVVATDIQNRGAQEAAKIGNSQSSLGLMAERVANPSGMTSGLANYTYDRTLRPTINSLSTSLVTEGKVNALSEFLRNELSKAKQNYQNAAASAGNNNNNNGTQLLNEITDNEFTGELGDNLGPGDTFSVGQSSTNIVDRQGNQHFYLSTPDGKGGAYMRDIYAQNADEAKKKYQVVGIGSSSNATDLQGNKEWYVTTADGKYHVIYAKTPEEAKAKWYQGEGW